MNTAPAHLALVALLTLAGGNALATGVYQAPEAFLAEVFAGKVPDSKTVWLTGETGKAMRGILRHKPASLRWRYWMRDGRSAWVVEEIGKTRPITTGIVVRDDQIEQVRILAFRESRGWEVRFPAFTRQFERAALADGHVLDRNIDGISGATLSVRAVTGLARAVLYLHGQVTGNADVTP